MSTLTETSQWDASVNKVDTSEEITEVLLNSAPQSLANRTLWLKNLIASHRHDGTVASLDYASAAGTANALTMALTPALTAHVPGLPIWFKAASTNTGPATVAINSLSPVSIKRADATDLAFGHIRKNGMYCLLYTGTTYVLMNPSEPVGFMQIGLSVSTPPGYLSLSGAAVSRSTYADLWAWAQANSVVVTESAWSSTSWGSFSVGDGSTTFRLPDFRGEFPRFWDAGKGVDLARQFGTRQADTFKTHQHTVPRDARTPGSIDANYAGSESGGTPDNTGTLPGEWPFKTLSNSDGGGTETRPRNITVVPYIRF